jgi:hypothetical protein
MDSAIVSLSHKNASFSDASVTPVSVQIERTSSLSNVAVGALGGQVQRWHMSSRFFRFRII